MDNGSNEFNEFREMLDNELLAYFELKETFVKKYTYFSWAFDISVPCHYYLSILCTDTILLGVNMDLFDKITQMLVKDHEVIGRKQIYDETMIMNRSFPMNRVRDDHEIEFDKIVNAHKYVSGLYKTFLARFLYEYNLYRSVKSTAGMCASIVGNNVLFDKMVPELFKEGDFDIIKLILISIHEHWVRNELILNHRECGYHVALVVDKILSWEEKIIKSIDVECPKL